MNSAPFTLSHPGHHSQTRVAWVKRAGFAAVLGVSTGFVAHVVMGGVVPGLLGILPAMVAATLLGLVFLYKPTVLGTITTTLLSQYLFHQWASLGVAEATTAHHHGVTPVALAGVVVDLPMSAGHLVAALVTSAGVIGGHRVIRMMRRLRSMLASLWLFPAVYRATPLISPNRLHPQSWWLQRPRPVARHWAPSGLRAPPSFSCL